MITDRMKDGRMTPQQMTLSDDHMKMRNDQMKGTTR